jgi:hypothetical protein
MKAINLILVLVVVVAVSVMSSVNCVQTEHEECRETAKELGYDQALINRVTSFAKHGPPDPPMTCERRCNDQGFGIGFYARDKLRCCCGIF